VVLNLLFINLKVNLFIFKYKIRYSRIEKELLVKILHKMKKQLIDMQLTSQKNIYLQRMKRKPDTIG